MAIGQQPATAAGRITGTIKLANGRPASSAPVAINVRPVAVGVPFPPFHAKVVTDASGNFGLSGVPPATYAICPQPPDASSMAPCSWGIETRATVTAGQTTAVPPIQLQNGALLSVRVNDPKGTRASQEGKVPGASLLLVVKAPNGAMIPIPQTGQDPSGFDHQLTVPTDTDLVIIAHSSAFALADSAGKAVAGTNFLVPVRIPANAPQHREVIQIR